MNNFISHLLSFYDKTPLMTRGPEISVAPMMDWTDRHFRYFARLISPNVRLYTEMITTGAIVHGDTERFLKFHDIEHPVALQLGGSSSHDLAKCAKIGEQFGYNEINLNCGCPSDRVQKGKIGACLMMEPDLVADCVSAMIDAVQIPVTVKCRMGVDHHDSFEFLEEFVHKVADKGCKTFIIHARKAWLKGLSPKENREIPALNHARVKKIKETYPHLCILTNGGITTVQETQKHLQSLDGVMIGRAAYQNPYLMADIEQTVFNNQDLLSRDEIAQRMIAYAKEQREEYETPVKSITRHILGLYHEQPGAKAWRRTLSTLPYQDNADENVIETALEAQTDAANALHRAA